MAILHNSSSSAGNKANNSSCYCCCCCLNQIQNKSNIFRILFIVVDEIGGGEQAGRRRWGRTNGAICDPMVVLSSEFGLSHFSSVNQSSSRPLFGPEFASFIHSVGNSTLPAIQPRQQFNSDSQLNEIHSVVGSMVTRGNNIDEEWFVGWLRTVTRWFYSGAHTMKRQPRTAMCQK